MKILVCGGRDYDDFEMVYKALFLVAERINLPVDEDGTLDARKLTIIHGAARGADSIAAYWGKIYNANVMAFPADWDKHGKAAGHIRNAQMLSEGEPDCIMFFPGGRGTENMKRQGREKGIRLIDGEAFAQQINSEVIK